MGMRNWFSWFKNIMITPNKPTEEIFPFVEPTVNNDPKVISQIDTGDKLYGGLIKYPHELSEKRLEMLYKEKPYLFKKHTVFNGNGGYFEMSGPKMYNNVEKELAYRFKLDRGYC